ncbi:hypothetical protein DH86_00003650 [Scytalidium sp. 3C]|nr:hypothetical protein DH86_00003650 [Scytalidium sp. 3C]
MSKEARFAHHPFVTGFPHMPFYAEVPVFTPSGYVIGTYTVVDNKPRFEGHDEVLSVLREISAAIMNHLELVSFKQTFRRASRMVSGLAHFVEGTGSFPPRPSRQQSSISIDRDLTRQVPQDETEEIPLAVSPGPDDAEAMVEGAVGEEAALQELVDELAAYGHLDRSPVPTPATQEIPPDVALLDTGRPLSEQMRDYFNDSGRWDVEADSAIGMSSANASPWGPSDMEESTDSSVSSSSKSKEVRETLARACSLVREAIDLDGVLFLDASWSSYQLPYRIAAKVETPPASGTPASSNDSAPWPSIQLHSDKDNGPPVHSSTSIPASSLPAPKKLQESKCSILCQSLRPSYKWHGVNPQTPPSLTESSLQALLSEFPRGGVFYFDESGYITSSCADDSSSDSGSDTALHFSVATSLLKLIPGARSIAMLPLRDSTKSNWFTVGRPIRVEDYAYLRAFGNSVMVEVSRLEIISADQAKTVFLSSISHELRSPLHGILANSELLSTTSTGPVQDEMIEAIEVCGRTLLDTMDHLLDFAKINNFNAKIRPRGVDGTASSGTHNLTSEFDMSNIVQDVVHGVLAGYKYQRTSPSQFWKRDHVDHSQNPLDAFADNASHVEYEGVTVIMDIQERPDWVISSEPGAWKRILMNLFGNALKYTAGGFIKVALTWEDIPSSDPAKPPEALVSLTVSDSGKGMSKQYLKNNLFTPFAQEDSLSVGAGLGLSIVKQLVVALGGTIKVESELGRGTVVTVSAPVVVRGIMDAEKVDLISKVQEDTRGLSFSAVIDDANRSAVCNTPGEFPRLLKPASELLRSIERIATSWFRMTNQKAPGLCSSSADIVVTTEAGLECYLRWVVDNNKKAEWDLAGNPVILLTVDKGDSLYRLASSWNRDNGRVIRLPLPVSPRNFAKALRKCLQYRSTPKANPEQLGSKEDVSAPKDTATEFETPLKEQQKPLSLEIPQAKTEPDSTITTTTTTQEPVPNKGLVLHPAAKTGPVDPCTVNKDIQSNPNRDPDEGPYVLLVEDNEINLKILATYMNRLKYRYATATNGLEAVQLYTASTTCSPDSADAGLTPPKSSPFDFIIMDISMPVMDGFEATRQIRMYEYKHALNPVTVLALTGLASAQAQQEASNSGIDTYLTKPARLGDLKKLLSKRQS